MGELREKKKKEIESAKEEKEGVINNDRSRSSYVVTKKERNGWQSICSEKNCKSISSSRNEHERPIQLEGGDTTSTSPGPGPAHQAASSSRPSPARHCHCSI
jgi:hypothetical protein